METTKTISIQGVSWQTALDCIFSEFITIADEENCLRPRRDGLAIEHPQQPPKKFDMELTLTCIARITPEKGRLQCIIYKAMAYPQNLINKTPEHAYGIVSCEAHL